MKKLIKIVIALLLAPTLMAGEVKLAWDWEPLPDSDNTNSPNFILTGIRPFSTITNTVSINAGTNKTATIIDLIPGIWTFNAKAVMTNGVSSGPSSSVAVEVPPAPTNMRTIALQYSATVSNFVDVGFFKVRFP